MTTTWYIPETRAEAEAELAAEHARFLAQYALGHIYVIEFASGVVKVGRTATPKGRVAVHALLAAAHGGSIQSVWVSHRIVGSASAERELIDFCGRNGQLAAGREYFRINPVAARLRASLIAHNQFPASALSADERSLLEGEVPA
jgi:hypothetical protein